MIIRKFTDADLDKVMNIWLDSNIQAHSFISEGYWKIASNFVKRAIPVSEVYVCENEEGVCGFAGIEDSYIIGLFVEDSARSKGIGKMMLDYIKNIREELTLNVYQKNERAIEFYKREKFTVEAETVDQNTKEQEFVMSWRKC